MPQCWVGDAGVQINSPLVWYLIVFSSPLGYCEFYPLPQAPSAWHLVSTLGMCMSTMLRTQICSSEFRSAATTSTRTPRR